MTGYLEEFTEEVKKTGYSAPSNPVFSFLKHKETNSTRKLMIDTELYRARILRGTEPINISKGYYGYDSRGSFVNPNVNQITSMRANRAGQPRLYCADVNYLAMIEVRPTVGGRISLATLKVNDVLTILDFTLFHIPYGMDEEKQKIFADISKLFSTPVNQEDDKSDYLVTQEIADFVESLGYDGIAYSSSLSPALNKENYNCCNLVIFNYDKCAPVKSNVMEMRSKYDSKGLDYDYSDFVQIDNDTERLNLIGHKEKMYDLNFPFRSKQKSNKPIGLNKNIFVSTARQIYNIPVRVLGYPKEVVIHVGGSFTITIPHKKRIPKTQFSLADSLNNRVNDLTLLFDSVAEGELWFGDREQHRRGSFSMKLSLDEYGKDIDGLRRQFEFCKEIKKALLKININADINMQDPALKDKMQIDIIRNCVLHNMILSIRGGEKQSRLQAFDIQGQKVFLIFERVGKEQYKVLDFFGQTIEVTCSIDEIEMTVPQYSTLNTTDYISASNINFNVISSSYPSLYNQSNLDLPLRANEDVWNILLAYNISKDSRFLHLAEQINEWVITTNYKPFIDNDIPYINRCYIKKLKGMFYDADRQKLNSLISDKSTSDFLVMAYILLDDFITAKKYYGKLPIQMQKKLLDIPIVSFCPQIKDWIY